MPKKGQVYGNESVRLLFSALMGWKVASIQYLRLFQIQ